MASCPRVSIAIRAYRRAWLHDAIASVLSQSFRDLELIVYDDAGDLGDLAASFTDGRLRYHRATKRLEASGRFSAAVALCRGDYIGMLDDDDRYEPGFVQSLVDVLDADARAGVAFCRTTWDVGGRRVLPADPRPAGRQHAVAADTIGRGWIVTPSLMLIRRGALDDAEREQAMPDGVAPDVFLNVRIALAGWRHVLVDARLVTCRWHAGQATRTYPLGFDLPIATWRSLVLHDADLASLRDAQIARSLLRRASARLLAGDHAGARRDVAEADGVSPSAWRGSRRVLRAAVALGPIGRMAARAVWALPLVQRQRKNPPAAIGFRRWTWRREHSRQEHVGLTSRTVGRSRS